MKNYYYYKKYPRPVRRLSQKTKRNIHLGGISLVMIGVGVMIYYSFPVFSWKLFIEPATASFITHPGQNFSSDWLPADVKKAHATPSISSYTLTIPKIGVKDAIVSTQDANVDDHLIQYWDSPLPPEKGNSVIFGHSTLPQLFDANNYRTILANAYLLKVNDTFSLTIDKTIYSYKIIEVFITDPQNTWVLSQRNDDSYVTIITCTPPGTVWKRLIVRARLIKNE